MRQNWSRVKCAALAALGVLGTSSTAVAAETTITGNVPTVASSTASMTIIAPFWIYSSTPATGPFGVASPAAGGLQVPIIREGLSLRTSANLHSSTDQENGITVVRGPLTR